MLIENTFDFKKNDQITLKLITSEEIIADFLAIDGEFLTVQHPLTATTTKKGVNLRPYMLTTHMDEKLKIHKNHILIVAKPNEEAIQTFKEAVTRPRKEQNDIT
jgi:hypothetical protein